MTSHGVTCRPVAFTVDLWAMRRSRRLLPGGGRTWLREFGLALVTAGFVVLLFAAYELVGTNLSEEHSQSVLARQFQTALARSAPPQVASQTAAAATNENTARHAGFEDLSGEGTGGTANRDDGSTAGNMAGTSSGQTKRVHEASPTVGHARRR